MSLSPEDDAIKPDGVIDPPVPGMGFRREHVQGSRPAASRREFIRNLAWPSTSTESVRDAMTCPRCHRTDGTHHPWCDHPDANPGETEALGRYIDDGSDCACPPPEHRSYCRYANRSVRTEAGREEP